MPYQPDVFMAGFYVISRLTWEQGGSVYLPLPILLIFKRHLNEQNLYTFPMPLLCRFGNNGKHL